MENTKLPSATKIGKAFIIRTVVLALAFLLLILICSQLYEDNVMGLLTSYLEDCEKHDIRGCVQTVMGVLFWVLITKLCSKLVTCYYLLSDRKKEDFKNYLHHIITSRKGGDSAAKNALGEIGAILGAILWFILSLLGNLIGALFRCILYAFQGIIKFGVGTNGMMGALVVLIGISFILTPVIFGIGVLWILLPYLIPICLYFLVDNACTSMTLKFYGFKTEEITYQKNHETKTTNNTFIRGLCSFAEFFFIPFMPLFFDLWILPMFMNPDVFYNLSIHSYQAKIAGIVVLLLYSVVSFIFIYIKFTVMQRSGVLQEDTELVKKTAEKLENRAKACTTEHTSVS